MEQDKNQLNQESRIPYSDRKGEDRDKEILERYRVMVDYYIENPHRIQANLKELRDLWGYDAVLRQDESLWKRLTLSLV